MHNIDLKIKTKQMQNSNSNDGTEVPQSKNVEVSTSSQTIAKPTVSSRFFIDERVGCIAVRDRKHPEYHPDYPGLHNDTADVIFYAHGSKNDEGWFVDERWRRKADEVLKHLMSLENGG